MLYLKSQLLPVKMWAEFRNRVRQCALAFLSLFILPLFCVGTFKPVSRISNLRVVLPAVQIRASAGHMVLL